jgi:hypothetical protein
MGLLVFLCVVIGLPFLLLGLLEVFAPQSGVRENLGRRLARFKIWHFLAVVAAAGLLFAMFTSTGSEPFLLTGLIFLTLFLRAWRNEFTFLMGLRDSDFPGRNDKLIWAVTLLFLAPVGLWLFRAYRHAHWPEAETEPRADSNSRPLSSGDAMPEPT